MDQQELFKGERLEEQLRMYFLSLGYFVARGVPYRFQSDDISDLDLFLYSRLSPLARQRINVDAKNRAKPQAAERIVWAKGIASLLEFDQCIVATTDKRSSMYDFGKLHNVSILDGVFLARLPSNSRVVEGFTERIVEEDLLKELARFKSYRSFGNRDWRFVYKNAQARLTTEMDYSGLNATLIELLYFLEKVLSDMEKRSVALRMLYLLTSYFLIIADFILKDIAFLEQQRKEKNLIDGLNFGNLGGFGVDQILDMTRKLSGGNISVAKIRSSLEFPKSMILREFLARTETSNMAFSWAREFEALAFQRVLKAPADIDPRLKGVLGTVCDYASVERKLLL